MPKIRQAFMRTKRHWVMWQELQKAIDDAPVVIPCTNFPDLFYGDSGDTPLADVRQAKQLCSTCPVQLECAIYALEANEDYGVWGGLSPLDRKKLKNKHGSYRKAAQALELRYTKPESNRIQANRR